MSVVLVTGGAGFIGSHLCERLLQQNNIVINIDNFNDFYLPSIKRDNIKFAKTNPNYILIEGDIRDEGLLRNVFNKYEIDIVVHLAAIAGVRKSIKKPLEYIDVDIKGTVALLEACKNKKINKFIFASSSSIYGQNQLPFRESDNIKLVLSPYAASKFAGESFCRTYNHLYNIPFACLRFFTVYGPRQRPEMCISSFIDKIWNGREIQIYGNGKTSRDYTYVDDIVDGIISAIEYDCNFEIFNLGSSNPIQLNSLIDLIENKLKKSAIKKYMSRQKGDVENTFADITKAKSLLNYEPKVMIDQGIDKSIKWYFNLRK